MHSQSVVVQERIGLRVISVQRGLGVLHFRALHFACLLAVWAQYARSDGRKLGLFGVSFPRKNKEGLHNRSGWHGSLRIVQGILDRRRWTDKLWFVS